MCIKVKQLGIDFGSSKTSLVACYATRDEKSQKEVNKFCIICEPRTSAPFFGSYMGEIRQDNVTSYLYFQDVFNSDSSAEVVLWDDLKKTFPNNFEHVKNFFAQIKNVVTKKREDGIYFDFSGLEKIVFGHPAYSEPGVASGYCKKMTQLLKTVFFENEKCEIIGCPEPVLAASAYDRVCVGRENRMKQGDVLLVIDLGGFTMDLALLQMEYNKKALTVFQHIPSGSIHGYVSMGQEMTRRITRVVYDDRSISFFDPKIESMKCELFKKDDCATRKTRRKYSISKYPKGKECFILRYSEDINIPSNLDDETICVTMKNGNYNISIEDIYDSCADCIEHYLSNVSLKSSQNFHVLFTGGTSGIAELRNTILNRLRARYTIEEENVKVVGVQENINEIPFMCENEDFSTSNAVALGAAFVARGDVIFKTEKKLKSKPKSLSEEEIRGIINKLYDSQYANVSIREKIKACKTLNDLEELKALLK